jgi:hypothetical protein
MRCDNLTGFSRALVASVIVLVLFATYGYHNFYRDPGSIFYNPKYALERRYSLYREKEALAFRDAALSGLNQDVSKSLQDSQSIFNHHVPTICGVIVTIARPSSPGGAGHLEVGEPHHQQLIFCKRTLLRLTWLFPSWPLAAR